MSLKIMVADDQPKSAQLLRALATPLGHTVLPTGDYRAAGEKGEAQPFDVAFVGMRLPELSGLQLAHRIRSSERNHDATIVMLISAGDIPNMRKAFGEGADLVLTEPLHDDQLRRMLTAMDSPDWKQRKAAVRLPLFTNVTCAWDDRQYSLQSLNISETGMLLKPSVDAEIGREVSLTFKIQEIHSFLNVQAGITRKEVTERVAVEFIRLAQEDKNAIEVYVMGHMREFARTAKDLSLGPRRIFGP